MEYWRGIIFFGNYVYYHWSREPGEDRDGYRGMCTGVSSLLSFFFFSFFFFFFFFPVRARAPRNGVGIQIDRVVAECVGAVSSGHQNGLLYANHLKKMQT